MKTIAVTIAVLIATLACYVAWADFPDECEPHERESDHRQALCKWNRGELTIESMEFQAYPRLPQLPNQVPVSPARRSASAS